MIAPLDPGAALGASKRNPRIVPRVGVSVEGVASGEATRKFQVSPATIKQSLRQEGRGGTAHRRPDTTPVSPAPGGVSRRRRGHARPPRRGPSESLPVAEWTGGAYDRRVVSLWAVCPEVS